MKDNVIDIGITPRSAKDRPINAAGDIDPDAVLEAGKGRMPKGVTVIGYNEDGDVIGNSSLSDLAEILWLIEIYKADLIQGPDA